MILVPLLILKFQNISTVTLDIIANNNIDFMV